MQKEDPLLNNPFGGLNPHWNVSAYRKAIQAFWSDKPEIKALDWAAHWLPGIAHPPEPITVKRLMPLLDRAICRVVLEAKRGQSRAAATSFVEQMVSWDVCVSGGNSKAIDKLKLLRLLERSGMEPSLVTEILNCGTTPSTSTTDEETPTRGCLDIRTVRCAMANTKWHCNAHYQREILAAMGDKAALEELEKARRALHDERHLSKSMAEMRLSDAADRRTNGGQPTRAQKKKARDKRQATMLLSQSRLLAFKHLLDAMAAGRRTLYTQSISTFQV